MDVVQGAQDGVAIAGQRRHPSAARRITAESDQQVGPIVVIRQHVYEAVFVHVHRHGRRGEAATLIPVCIGPLCYLDPGGHFPSERSHPVRRHCRLIG
jgi:hypothetical protein